MTLTWVVMLAVALLIGTAVSVALILAVRRSDKVEDTPARTRATAGAQKRVAAALSALALTIFVFGVVMTESALEVETTGPDGLAGAVQTAQRDIDIPTAATDPLEIKVTGQRWLWRYEYPDTTYSYYELVVPVDTTVILNIGSTDVLHRWFVPGLTGMFDALPGSSNKTWFKADETGIFRGRSMVYSGAGTPAMRTVVSVVSPDEYEAWLEDQKNNIADAQQAVQDRLDAENAANGKAGS